MTVATKELDMEEEIKYLPALFRASELRTLKFTPGYLYCVCLLSDEIAESNVRVIMAKWDMGHKSYLNYKY